VWYLVEPIIDLRIKIDSREQRPWEFPAGVQTVIGKLDEGDYAIEGLEGKFGIERKSLPDMWQSLTHDRDRFERELRRVKEKKISEICGNDRGICQ